MMKPANYARTGSPGVPTWRQESLPILTYPQTITYILKVFVTNLVNVITYNFRDIRNSIDSRLSKWNAKIVKIGTMPRG